MAVLPSEPQVGDRNRRGMGSREAVPRPTVEGSPLGSVVKVSTQLAGLGDRAGIGNGLDVVKAADS